MTSATLAVLQWISVHVCTTTKSTNQESLTHTTVDPGKMRTSWVPLFFFFFKQVVHSVIYLISKTEDFILCRSGKKG